jgi:hypothetical protein
MATIELLEKIYERWSSHCEENNGIRKKMTITTIFVVLLDCLLIILIVFFPL